jgi:hypothetical protein
MSDDTSTWQPRDKDEEKAKEAFENALIHGPSSVVKEQPGQSSKRFILQTDGYHGELIE